MKKKKYLAFLSAMMCCISLASCGESSQSKYEKKDNLYINTQSKAVVMIIGNHACSMKIPQDVYNSIEKDMDDIVYGGYFALINADSTPTKVEVKDQTFFVEDRKSENAVEHEIEKRKPKLKEAIKEAAEIPPDSIETDLLQAIREAKSILSGCDSVKKEIIIVDTGISTAGDLNLCSINFAEDPSQRRTVDSIIDEYLLNFEDRNILPDLSGIDIVFYGEHGYMAPTASPQSDSMITTDEQYIKELWEAIVTKSGAASVSFTEIAGWDTPIIANEEIPHVSTVLFKRPIPKIAPNPLDPTTVNPPDINLSISCSSIGFNADKSTLISPDNFTSQYNSVAMNIQKYLEDNSDKKIYIAGAVAKYGDNNGYKLSYERAEAIKRLLTDGSFKDDNGDKIYINADQIAIIGLGDKFPDKIDEYPGGTFEESLALQNRKVFIFSAPDENSSEEEIRESYYTKLKDACENGSLNDETIADIKKAFN